MVVRFARFGDAEELVGPLIMLCSGGSAFCENTHPPTTTKFLGMCLRGLFCCQALVWCSPLTVASAPSLACKGAAAMGQSALNNIGSDDTCGCRLSLQAGRLGRPEPRLKRAQMKLMLRKAPSGWHLTCRCHAAGWRPKPPRERPCRVVVGLCCVCALVRGDQCGGFRSPSMKWICAVLRPRPT